jgi:hypothetical protein
LNYHEPDFITFHLYAIPEQQIRQQMGSSGELASMGIAIEAIGCFQDEQRTFTEIQGHITASFGLN